MVNKLFLSCALSTLGWIAATSLLNADTISTRNGSNIQGKILGIEDGIVKIETEFAGTLSIKQELIEAIDTDKPMFVEFNGGNTILGKVTTTGSSVNISANDGQFNSDIKSIQSSWHDGEDSPTERKYKAELEAKKRKWKNEISAEIVGTSGNTDSLNTGIGINSVLESDQDKLTLYGNYSYGQTENSVSTDKSRGGVRYQSNFYENFFWYVRDEVGRDNVQDLDLYNVAGAGIGYQFIKSDKQNLSINVGLAYRYESYGNGTDVSVPAGDFGLEHDYLFSFGKMYNKITFIPSFDDFSDYRLNHESGLEFPVGSTENWKLRTGISNEYHSNPQVGRDNLDNSYFTRLVYGF